MKVYRVLCCIVFLGFICLTRAEYVNNKLKTEVDLVIDGLGHLDWSKHEKPCLDQTLQVLNGVKNYTVWAVWIWNSMHHPVGSFYGSRYSLGNYDQCLKAPSNFGEPTIKTQYCLTDVKVTDKENLKYGSANVHDTTEEFLSVKSKEGRRADTISWGVCLPAVCSHESVTKILKAIYLVNPITPLDPQITVDYCNKAGEKPVYSLRFYLFIFTIISLIATTIASSLYLEFNNTDSALRRIAYSFSLRRNWSSFAKITDDEIPVLSFTKAVVMSFTTCVHVFVFIVAGSISNGHDYDSLISVKDNIFGNTFQHLDLPAVENFFVISGLLLMKGLMEKKRNPIITLIQRYVRLIGSFSVLIFYTLAVSEYAGDGPLWKRNIIDREQKACEKSWLVGLLMLGNYVDSDNICQQVSWYIPADYHLAVMGTALFCLWQWNRQIGKITTIIAVIYSVVITGITTYSKRLPGILLYDIEKLIHVRDNVVYTDTYMKSHHRAGSYFLGMAMGYIITVYRPNKYRGVISKECSYLGLAAAFMLGLKVLSSAPAWCLGEYHAWSSAIYAALNRNLWALATCVCIGITEYGDVQILRKLMSWPGFTIFSRLAYGVYITHSLILERFLFSQRNPMHYDMFNLILNGIGILIISAALAVLLWLFVESPLSNLANLLLIPTKKTSSGIENVKEINEQSKATELKTKAL
ncbi:nose resistant to fluoxetine protein 6-like [Spodoptera frugiperda]|uniref:Nose resistant to fluoxetine protein 6-like n=1 Tax=Spodoptera frugiperda TaxID=7108 RepID=A0A9R0EQ05_SPOFR|nr:nose resistant to fluoxetine protein 6-like [Spodoptera frugiperda]